MSSSHLPLASTEYGDFADSDSDSRCAVCKQHGPLNNAPCTCLKVATNPPYIGSYVCDEGSCDVFRSKSPLFFDAHCRRRSHTNRHNFRRKHSCVTTARVLVVFAATVMVIFSSVPSEAFSPSLLSSQIRPNLTRLNSSVRKRSGNHDVSAPKIEHLEVQRKQSLVEIQMRREQQKRRRSKNVFEQFTPDYIKTPFDVDVLPKYPESIGASVNVKGESNDKADGVKSKQKHLSQRLQTLLQNDEGEQDYFADDSPEAAQQIADIKIYGKLSEEARRKATEAVKEVKKRSRKTNGEGPGDGAGQLLPVATTRMTRKSTVRATVKETGSDSINSYVKSLGQHELLNKADEVLLARQVRLLITLEDTRKMLEKQQLR